ncbi:MAG TPA: hypothetical protein DCZ93_11765 [Elusimicrobia bacterium]|nr:hypothetical protein [Elusimicrobiota bacterium]
MEVLSFSEQNAVTFDKKKSPNDSFSDTRSRVSLGASFDLNEDASAGVTAIKCDRQYDSTVQQTVAGGTIDAFKFYEAYLNLKNVFGIDHKVGKQFYGKTGDIIIYYGPSGWTTRIMTAASLEGWTGIWKKDKLVVTGLSAKYNEGLTTTLTDKDISGLTASYDYSEIVKPTAYIYRSDDRNTVATLENRLIVAGVKAEGKYMDVTYAAEYAMNKGSNRTAATAVDYNGNAMKFNAKYNFGLGLGNLEASGEFARGTGDKASASKNEGFKAINSHYRPGIIVSANGYGAGVASKFTSLDNLTCWNASLKAMPKDLSKLNVTAKYVNLKYTEKVGTAKDIGNELDMTATWAHSDNLSIQAAYAMFMPDKDIAIATKHDAVNLMILYASVKF